MTKNFCDICEEPASKKFERIEIKIPFGNKYKDKDNESQQCYITASVRFGYTNHRDGFGGPDLCDKCIFRLVDKLRDVVR